MSATPMSSREALAAARLSLNGGSRAELRQAPVVVRPATVDDVDLLHRFSVDLATYEDEPDAVTSTPQTLARDGFGADPQVRGPDRRARRQAGRLRALHLQLFGLDRGARHLHRGHLGRARGTPRRRRPRADGGAGPECAAKGFKRIDLNVLDWNPARGFYERIGFRWIRNWLPYRLSGEALRRRTSSLPLLRKTHDPAGLGRLGQQAGASAHRISSRSATGTGQGAERRVA